MFDNIENKDFYLNDKDTDYLDNGISKSDSNFRFKWKQKFLKTTIVII